MDQSDFEQKAIPLVFVNGEGKYEIHPDAEIFLRKVPKPISVISVAGLYRTGKSYLLNRILLNRNNGFGVGPTINPCTKGLWCWGVPLKGVSSSGEKLNILIVDSEGIGALDEDQNHDVKIFTLAILTSSTFIYNSVGSIDENALQNLSLVVNLTKNIQLSTSSNSDDDDPDDLAQYFPTFFWVVRDFALQLINSDGETITPKDYLERALAPQKGFSDDVEEKNRIRRMLSAFFKQRECATLVRPLVNQQKLQHLYDCKFDDLRPQFVEQALNLRKRVLTNAKPKMLKGETLDGNMYISMLNSYLTAINEGGVPNIQNAWTYMCMQKCMKLQQQCYQFFLQQINKNLKQNFPCSTEEFQNQIEAIQNECYSIFQRQEIGDESKEYLKQLKMKIKQKIVILRHENQKDSINVLKNYIIKNFTVIQKKMRMNQYQNFQDFQKSVNSFYMHLLENGPNLPKKQIVYSDFLKKVTAQGAQIFLKQANQQLDSLKNISLQKQKLLRSENEDLRGKLRKQLQVHRAKYDAVNLQKIQLQKRYRQTEQTFQQFKATNKQEMNKMQANYENKIKILEIKLGQLTISADDIKQKKQNLETICMLQKKQRQKQKAVLQLKINQYKEDLKNLKSKEKTQQLQINELNGEYSSKLRQSSLEYQRKINELTNELKNIKDKYHEIQQNRDALQNKLDSLQRNSIALNKKHQEDMKSQIQKFQNYKLEFESDKLIKIEMLEEQNKNISQTLKELKNYKIDNEKILKEINDKGKSIISEHSKEVAILNQKIEFINHELNQNKQNYGKSIQYYQSLLKNKNQMIEEQLTKGYKQKLSVLEESYSNKIHQIEQENAILKEKNIQAANNNSKIQETYKFQFQLLTKKYQGLLKTKIEIIQALEEEKNQLYCDKQNSEKNREEEFKTKESELLQKIKQMQYELESAYERATQEQSQYNNKSQETLKQLKNYYELEKQKLQHKIAIEKDKFQKKMQKIRQEYQNQLQEQRRTAQEEYENLKDQFTNQQTCLRNCIDNLQHDSDSKAKSIQILEKRCQQQKERLQKKQVEFNNRYDQLIKNTTQQKQIMQAKIFEGNEQKSMVQKEVILLNHQKQQLTKELKQIAVKFQSKTEEIFYLNKNVQKITNQNRQKINELNNQYMNERLNYQKKIALCEQQKQFFSKKLDQYEKDQNKNSLNWEDKVKKMKIDYQDELSNLQNRKNSEIGNLESKYDKLKKNSKQNELQMMRNVNTLQKQLAIEKEKFNNLFERYHELQEKKSVDGDQLQNQLNNVKQQLTKIMKQSQEELIKLKKQYSELQNDRNQLLSLYQRDKILMENKNNFLEDIKEKNKKEYLEKIKNLETTLENIQKNRMNEKNYYENIANQSTIKIEKKYQITIQQNSQNWNKKQQQYETNIKKMQSQVRSLTEKIAYQNQAKSETIKSQERKIKELQDNQKRALTELQKYKYGKQTLNIQNVSSLQKERQVMKQKIQQKEEKYKNLQKIKQQLYYDFEKQKARWNLQKDNYSMKNEQLKDIVSKNERDLQKLHRENQKLKAQKKCYKMNMAGNSRYSFQKTNSSKYNLQDSINSINTSMLMSKQNCDPLGDLSFFKNNN